MTTLEEMNHRYLRLFTTDAIHSEVQKNALKKLGWIEYSRMGAFWRLTDSGKAEAERLGYL